MDDTILRWDQFKGDTVEELLWLVREHASTLRQLHVS
jgi:hypothetical protein